MTLMAAVPGSTTDLVTVEQFYALVGDGRKADLIDGVIYMASPDTLRNDELAGFVSGLLRLYADAKDAGRVLGSRFAFVLSPIRAPEPDVAFVRRERLHLLGQQGMEGGPDIAAEIVSRDSRDCDYGEKRRLYQDAGVSEYWSIDPLQRRAEFHLLREGRYELAPLEANRLFRSDALPGFFLDVDWLFADLLPKVQAKFDEILAASA